MLNFILTFLLVAAGIGTSLFIAFDRENEKLKLNKKCLFGLIPIIAAILINCIVIVPANNVGIRYSIFTGTSENTLDEGISLKSPLDKIYFIDTTVQTRGYEGLSVQTKDSQFLNVTVNIKYRVNADDAFKVYRGYRTLDNLGDSIIGLYAQKSIESVMTQYNVIEVLGDKKNEIYQKISDTLSERLQSEGVQLVEIVLVDTDAGEEIESAIKNEAVAKKEVETAEQNRLKAEKDAETKLIEAQAEADANALLTEKLTDQILADKWIEKWDGKMPTVTGSDSNMIGLDSILGN